MKTEFRLSIALCVAIGACVSNPIAYACDCDGPADPKAAFESADAVFVGTITHRALNSEDPISWATGFRVPSRALNFHVSQSWKGVIGTEVGLVTGSLSDSCGLGEDVGTELLVYAMRLDENGALYTWSCGVAWFGRFQVGGNAEERIAEFARLGVAELELTEGADPLYPPSAISSPIFPICGTGIGMAFMMSTLSLIGLVRIARSRRGKGN